MSIIQLIDQSRVPVKKFFYSGHPDVYLVPVESYYQVVDHFGDMIGMFQHHLPLSSFSFYADPDGDSLFSRLDESRFFRRLAKLNQLGFLCPIKPQKARCDSRIFYQTPGFPHSRWIHSLLVGFMAEVVLANNGYTKEVRDAFVLTALCHDIATPAGGDSVIRIDPDNLSEENNFRLVMEISGLTKCLRAEYDFDLDEAEKWVRGIGSFGHLLDVLDKISYTALDAYHACFTTRSSRVGKFCRKHPLVADVWQDIRFDGQKSWFASAERLYDFLHLRALLFYEVYKNPRSRALDNLLGNQLRRYYWPELKSKLLSWSDDQLREWLISNGEEEIWLVSPDDYKWRKFEKEENARKFASQEQGFSHLERIDPFKTGLDWLVKSNDNLTQLGEVVTQEQAAELERLSKTRSGWYVYYC